MNNNGKGALAGTTAFTKISGGTLNEVANVTSVDTLDTVTEVANVTSVDTVDTLTSITNPVSAVMYATNASSALVAVPINSEGNLSVVTNGRPDNGYSVFSSDVSTTTDFIVIDISDTTNYPHVSTSYIHTENMFFNVDATSDADYTIDLGWLENVDGTNGDFYSVYSFGGTKKTGNSASISINHAPNSPRLISTKVLVSNKSLNDTAFQTDVNLGSTIAPGTANVPSGSGDMVVRVTINAGSIGLTIGIGYHTH